MSGVFIAVASEADFVGNSGHELYPCDTSIDPDLMTARAACSDRRMDRLALGFVFVACDAG